MSRGDVADFLAALILVYTICIVGWVVLSLVFSLGVRDALQPRRQRGHGLPARRLEPVPARCSAGSPLQVGPLDLSPMVAIIVLQIGGGIVVGLIRGS